MESKECLRSSPWNKLQAEFIRKSTDGAIVPYLCDLSSVLNNKEKLNGVRNWLEILQSQEQFGLFSLSHDSSKPISQILGPNALILRTSMQASLQYQNEFLLPVFLSEAEFNSFSVIDDLDKPTVGFVGHASPNLHHSLIKSQNVEMRNLYGYDAATGEELIRTPVNIGLPIRKRALKNLSDSTELICDFKLRESHFFISNKSNPDERNQFLTNLKNNFYSLCIRGSGNYSIRLFETLAAGRIPVIVETDLVLPFLGEINWNELAVMVKLNDLNLIAEIVLDHFNGLNAKQRVAAQNNSRNIWETYFTREKYFKLMANQLQKAVL